MYINHAEFVLLSRTGRGPYCTRAGPELFGLPAPPLEPERPGRLFRKRGRSGLLLRRLTPSGLSHGLGPRDGRSTRAARTLDHPGREYFEMEFVVGFPADEDNLL
jgi:hypothetical protein